jgi:plasmid stabilization system protein ParE
MTARYVLTPLAETDLDDTWDYIAENFGFNVADRVLDALDRAFQLIAENPGIGHSRADIALPPYSFWPVGPSLIAFRADLRPIQIVRVVRGEREWRGLLP